MKKLLVVTIILFSSIIALAAGGGDDHGGIPSVVMWQAINFSIFVGLLTFLTRKLVAKYFAGRKEAFDHALIKAQKVKEDAEQKNIEMTERLNKLTSGADNSIEQARKEAEDLRRKIIEEANQLSIQIREEAKRTADVELERAKLELRDSAIKEALSAARSLMKDNVQESDQHRFQKEFVDKIQVVR